MNKSHLCRTHLIINSYIVELFIYFFLKSFFKIKTFLYYNNLLTSFYFFLSLTLFSLFYSLFYIILSNFFHFLTFISLYIRASPMAIVQPKTPPATSSGQEIPPATSSGQETGQAIAQSQANKIIKNQYITITQNTKLNLRHKYRKMQ